MWNAICDASLRIAWPKVIPINLGFRMLSPEYFFLMRLLDLRQQCSKRFQSAHRAGCTRTCSHTYSIYSALPPFCVSMIFLQRQVSELNVSRVTVRHLLLMSHRPFAMHCVCASWPDQASTRHIRSALTSKAFQNLKSIMALQTVFSVCQSQESSLPNPGPVMHLSLYLYTLICIFLATTVLSLHLPLNGLTLSLGNLTLPGSLTADFNVHCVSIINPPQPGLNPTNCDQAVGHICSIFDQAHILHHPVPRNQWVWSEPTGFAGCSLGWYVPGPLHAPSFEECSEAFQAVNDKCARNSRFNAGNINIRTLPNLFSDGTAVNPTAMRYLMAPQQLSRWREAEKIPFPGPFSRDHRRILWRRMGPKAPSMKIELVFVVSGSRITLRVFSFVRTRLPLIFPW